MLRCFRQYCIVAAFGLMMFQAARLLGQVGASPPLPAPGSPAPPATNPQKSVPPPAQNPSPATPPKNLWEIHGQIFERYRDDAVHDSAARSRSSSVTFGNPTVSYNPTPLWSAYLRFAFELISPLGLGRDFNTNYYQGDTGFRGPAAFDQFGVVYHDFPHGLTITVGRQDEPLDVSSTLYDQSYKVGLHTFFDGISVVQKVSGGTIQGYAFSEDQYQSHETRNSLYALRGTDKVGPFVTLGSTLAHFAASADSEQAGIQSIDSYEADSLFKRRATQLILEFAKSNADTRNDLYYFGAKYTLTPRDILTGFGYKIAQNADIGRGSAFPEANRGARYSYEHFYSKRFESILYYETDRQLYAPGKSTSTQVTLLYSF